MIFDQLRIAFRSLKRQKGYVFLNVGGLAVGLASCAIIMLFVRDELSYDRFHPNAEQIYTLNASYQYSEAMRLSVRGMPLAMAQALEDEIAGVEYAVRWETASAKFTNVGDLDRSELIRLTDPAFFKVFNFSLLRGDPDTVLDDPSSLLITPEASKTYFGSDDPMGRTLLTDDGKSFVVTGVVETPPHNTEFDFDFIGRYERVAAEAIADEGSSAWYPLGQVTTYIRLAEGFSLTDFNSMMPDFLASHMGSSAEGFLMEPERLVDLHLRRQKGSSVASGLYGDIKYVWMFSGIAALILLIACINYTNLATARSLQRAREIGVRKAVGAGRLQLVRRFLGESLFLCTIATIVAILLVDRGLPAFSRLTGKEISVDWLTDPFLLPGFVVLTLIVSVLAGAYPSMALSRFTPILALRGVASAGSSRAWIRKGLVTFQFVISAGLIICTLVMVRQLNFMQTSDLGLEPGQIVSINLPRDSRDRYPIFKDEFRRLPNVESVTGGDVVNSGYMVVFEDDAPIRPSAGAMRIFNADRDYVSTLGLEIAAGSNFTDASDGGETVSVLLNEAAVQDLGLEDPIGQLITFSETSEIQYEVVGVVNDFHFQSLRRLIEPVMIQQSARLDRVLVKINTRDVKGTLAALTSVWNRIEQAAPFNYTFLDEQFDRLYENDRRTGNLFSLAAAFAIFVSCLGLFGLAAYSTQQRTREIGIRKVLGSTLPGIVVLVCREFLMLVGLAFILAAPIAGTIMYRWLDDFAYRIDLTAGMFIFAAVIAVFVALASVIWQAVQAAVVNPVDAIRSE